MSDEEEKEDYDGVKKRRGEGRERGGGGGGGGGGRGGGRGGEELDGETVATCQVVVWCMMVGIHHISLYDPSGL